MVSYCIYNAWSTTLIGGFAKVWSSYKPTFVMHIPPFRIRPASLSLLNTRSTFPFASRTYATHRNPLPSSLLSQSLDRTSRGNRSVGPFPLGISQPYVDHGEKVKKWSELSAGGKSTQVLSMFRLALILKSCSVARTTARTTNLAVILFGAGLSAVLVYALTTELFSKNSPTVLHNKACDKIKVSPEVCTYTCTAVNLPLTATIVFTYRSQDICKAHFYFTTTLLQPSVHDTETVTSQPIPFVILLAMNTCS